jgi:hypothetical protein
LAGRLIFSLDMFNGDLFDIDDDLDDFKIPLDHMPKGMNKASKFYNLPYWKELKVAHLLDPMHVFKNVSNSLWKHISSTEKDTNASRRYLDHVKDKERSMRKRNN